MHTLWALIQGQITYTKGQEIVPFASKWDNNLKILLLKKIVCPWNALEKSPYNPFNHIYIEDILKYKIISYNSGNVTNS